MTLNQLQPFFRKRPRSQATSPPLLQEVKDHVKMLVDVSPGSPQWVRFGIKDDFIELQGFRRREEQIKYLKVSASTKLSISSRCCLLVTSASAAYPESVRQYLTKSSNIFLPICRSSGSP